MKKILAIIWKDTLIRFSSKTELLFFLILPIIFTIILAGGTGPSNTDNRIRLLVVDEAKTPLSASLLAELEKSDTVRPELSQRATAEDELRQRRVSAWLVIPAGFSAEALQTGSAQIDLHQLPNNINALAAERAVLAVIRQMGSVVSIANSAVTAAEQVRPFESAAARQSYFDRSLELAQKQIDAAPQRLKLIIASTLDPVQYDPAANSSAGQLIVWTFIPLIGLSAMFAYERATGTLRRLFTTPTRKATYLLGTIMGQALTALVQMLLLVGFGILVMKIQWGRDLAGLLLILASSVLAAAALGVALGAFVKTEGQANSLSIMLGMSMGMLGGCMYPIELFPEAVRTAVKVLPTTWAMQGMLDLALRGKSWLDVLPVAGVLLGFAAVFFAIGVWRFRYE